MEKRYEQLKPEVRATVMLMRREGSSMRAGAMVVDPLLAELLHDRQVEIAEMSREDL